MSVNGTVPIIEINVSHFVSIKKLLKDQRENGGQAIDSDGIILSRRRRSAVCSGTSFPLASIPKFEAAMCNASHGRMHTENTEKILLFRVLRVVLFCGWQEHKVVSQAQV